MVLPQTKYAQLVSRCAASEDALKRSQAELSGLETSYTRQTASLAMMQTMNEALRGELYKCSLGAADLATTKDNALRDLEDYKRALAGE